MVLNRAKLPWMRDDRVILSLTIGAHNGDTVIEAYTHQSWSTKHCKKVRIQWTRQPLQKFSTDQWDLFMGWENTYNLKVRQHPSFTPMTPEQEDFVTLPKLSNDELLHSSFPPGISDSISQIHRLKTFNIQLSKNLIRQLLDACGFSCFRYRYNYSSNKISESMELAQYVDTSIEPENSSCARLNHRFFIIDAVPRECSSDAMKAKVAGKALITAMMKYMAGVSRTSEIEIFVLVGRGTRIRVYRIVFEPEYLGDIARGLVPEKEVVLWLDRKDDGSEVDLELMRHSDRLELVRRIEHIRLAMHVRI